MWARNFRLAAQRIQGPEPNPSTPRPPRSIALQPPRLSCTEGAKEATASTCATRAPLAPNRVTASRTLPLDARLPTPEGRGVADSNARTSGTSDASARGSVLQESTPAGEPLPIRAAPALPGVVLQKSAPADGIRHSPQQLQPSVVGNVNATSKPRIHKQPKELRKILRCFPGKWGQALRNDASKVQLRI